VDDGADVTGPCRRRRSGDDDHDPAVFRGDQDVPVAEAVHDDAFEDHRRPVDRAGRLPERGEGDAVGLAQVDPERLGALDHGRDVGVPAQQVIDEFAAQRLLVAHRGSPFRLVTVDEGAHRVVEAAQHRLRCPPHLLGVAGAVDERQFPPQPPGSGEVEVHGPPCADPLRGGLPAELADRIELPGLRPAAVDGRVGEDRQVLTEQVGRRTARRGRRRGDAVQPVVRLGRPPPALVSSHLRSPHPRPPVTTAGVLGIADRRQGQLAPPGRGRAWPGPARIGHGQGDEEVGSCSTNVNGRCGATSCGSGPPRSRSRCATAGGFSAGSGGATSAWTTCRLLWSPACG
jgi:hypothetical protein